jgi:hypothetical protein
MKWNDGVYMDRVDHDLVRNSIYFCYLDVLGFSNV